MKKFVLNYRKPWCICLAVYQIVGALVSLILVYSVAKNLGRGVIFALLPILAICLVSFMAGVLFFFKGNELRFFTLSKLNFCVQCLQLSLPGFVFIFYYGPYLAIGFDSDPAFRGKFETLTSSFAFKIGPTTEHYVLVNLVPLFLLIVLRWIERNPVVATSELENAFIEES